MFRLAALLSALLLAASGCSKKEGDAVSDTGEALAPDSGASSPPGVNKQIASDLNGVKQDLAGKKYEEAVGTLLMMQELPKNAEERELYEVQVRETQQMLLQQAQSDARAQQAYQMMSKMRLGR